MPKPARLANGGVTAREGVISSTPFEGRGWT
jgi:hypothetical protein